MIICEICGANYQEWEKECPNTINHEGLKVKTKNFQAIFRNLKKDELIAICKEKGIELVGEETKAKMIELLENFEKI